MLSKSLSFIIFVVLCIQCTIEKEVESIYENCCSVAPIELDLNPGKVYLPNIFTPNGDGINDIYFVQADANIEKVNEFRISDLNGNVVFESFDFLPNDISFGWAPNQSGSYLVYIKVQSTIGVEQEINGSLCAFVCDIENPFEFLNNCGFPAKHSGEGGFDPFLPSFEPACP